MNIVHRIFAETASLPPGKLAIRTEEGDLSYAELFEKVETVAIGLKKHGIVSGARVGLFFPDGVEYIILSLAILSIDAVFVPLPISSTPKGIEDILEKTSASFLISSAETSLPQSVCIQDFALNGFFLVRYAPTTSLPDDFFSIEPAFIRFSSGTTGESKGVILSHSAIIERTDAANQALKITSADTVLWVLPMSFHFVVSILLFLRCGATIYLCGERFPFALLSAVRRKVGTFIYATPLHYRTLIEDKTISSEMLNGVRMAISTATKLPTEMALSFKNTFGFALNEAYGIIEIGLPFVNRDPCSPDGSVGQILPDYELELRKTDSSGVGEIWLRGPGMYTAYLHPWRKRRDGEWFSTGDLGRLERNKFLCILGRSKTLINFAGMKIFPSEVEAVLNQFPKVSASLVYPKAHSKYGELPCAKVEAIHVTKEELLRYCYKHLESYKVPKEIEMVKQLKRTQSGKIKIEYPKI